MGAIRHSGGSERAGSALVISLFVVTLVAGIGAYLLHVHAAIQRRHLLSVDTKRALYIAEAGLTEAFAAVTMGKSGIVGSEETPAFFADGIYWVEAEAVGQDRIVLESHGMCGTGRFSVSEVLQRHLNPIASLGFFGAQDVTVRAGSVVDALSEPTQADPGTLGPGARVACNGDIVIESGLGEEGPTMVDGDAIPGPGGSVLLDPGATVTGSTQANPVMTVLPTIEVPALVSAGDFVHASPTVAGIPAGKVAYDRLSVGSGATLVLQGPLTLVVAALDVADGGMLFIDSTFGAVNVYCTETFDLQAGSTLMSPATTNSVALLLDGLALAPTLQAGGEFHGLIYAPQDALELPGSLRLYGAASASQLTLGQGSRLSFDLGMRRSGWGVDGVPRHVSWRITGLPTSGLVSVRIDPRTLLDLRGTPPTDSYLAQREQVMQLDYFDADGLFKSYLGLPKDFNWPDADSVAFFTWIDPVTLAPLVDGGVPKAITDLQ